MWNRSIRAAGIAAGSAAVAVAALIRIDGAAAPTRLLRQPTVSATHVAFAYANNIWSVERKGGVARRLTSFQGQTSNPRFSPDGRWIAFSAEYAFGCQRPGDARRRQTTT